ncbi:hypothetical protein ACBR40_15175 [Nonomuraea sp. AD125B]|uniref:hypothetical protein n=1 Tax=Nonomuraea TaxID=83681 RepID=UPI0031DEC28C
MNTFGVHVPGDSLLHRLPAGAKLLTLLVVIVGGVPRGQRMPLPARLAGIAC